MAEEEPTTASAEPVAAETATPEGDSAAADKNGEGGGANGKRQHKREDRVPVEELFDLTKPIPSVSAVDFLRGCSGWSDDGPQMVPHHTITQNQIMQLGGIVVYSSSCVFALTTRLLTVCLIA